MSQLKKAQKAMENAGGTALLITDISNVKWLTGFTGSYGFVILTPNDARFISDSRYTLQAKEQIHSMESRTFGAPTSINEFLKAQLAEMGITELQFEATEVTYDRFSGLEKALSGIKLTPSEEFLRELRMVKSPEEIENTRSACALADACFSHIQKFIQPGIAEFDIHLEIEFFFRRQRSELAFSPIVVSGARSARPHGVASEKKLEIGDFVTMDFGCKVNGMCSDLTRTVVVREASAKSIEIYNRVLEAETKCISAIAPGKKAADVDTYARQILGEYAQYFGHGLGHGLGGVVHDHGRMNSTSKDIFEIGQIWTVEPGVYIPDFGGVRIEDDVLVTETGVEILTHSPKELLILG